MSDFIAKLDAAKAAAAIAVEKFSGMKPAEKKLYIDKLYEGAMNAFEEGMKESSRRGVVQGFAFLWIDLYGKSPIDRAFRAKVKDRSQRPIFQNYRGAKNAWYFGSQSDVAYYDGLIALARYLNAEGVAASQGDEWD